ncbi:hypothetical protein [Thermus filiformis]|uniref:Bioflim formation protein n=1 Tax=Thermus filiformis TaxID=276 RepID=A0A0A2WQB4_THEFI|nr:hypothetical protein [Thermus filiformis]KGQ22008.2 hypothetical protein THFILI_10040 [Thermus filiformis]
MRKWVFLLVLALGLAWGQRLEVGLGSPYGLSLGVRLGLVPFLLEGRGYAALGYGDGAVLGGGADFLLKVPLTDLYLGLGGFWGTGNAWALGGTGQGGVRAVLGTWLNLGLPLLPVGFFAELHPSYFPDTGGLGLGGAVGVSLGF